MKFLPLLPCPMRIRHLPGHLPIPETVTVWTPSPPGVHLAWSLERLRDAWAQGGRTLHLMHGPRPRGTFLQVKADSPASTYSLTTVGERGIRISAPGETAAAYAVETLVQLVRATSKGTLPRLEIRDKPGLLQRGFYLDISRGKVPSMASLFQLVDRLAALKYNQLQLYMEHTFQFAFCPDIARGSGGLNAFEIEALDRHCLSRSIELVPSFACFGHMGKILSLPKYASLAECPFPAVSWEKASWRQRLRGSTVNPYHPGTRRLFQDIFRELLPLFSSDRFNLCGDETYDLGKGVNAHRARRLGIGKLYTDHLLALHRLAAEHNKTVMCWSDVLLHHPETIRRLPTDLTILDWGYEANTRFEKMKVFLDHGLQAMGVPATRSFRVIFNQVETARANIQGYARAAQRLGAAGILLTDWGDMGHFNLPAASLHAMAAGASAGWNPARPLDQAFDDAFSFVMFGDRSGKFGRLFRQAGTAPASSWPYFLETRRNSGLAPTAEDAHATLATADRWLAFLGTQKTMNRDHAELELALRALNINARKALREHGRLSARDGKRLVDDLVRFTGDYANHWKAHNRPEGLEDLQAAFQRLVRTLRKSR